MLACGARWRGLLSSVLFLATALIALAACFGVQAWGAPEFSKNTTASSQDTPQLSVAAPVQMTASLDPATGKVTVASGEIANNGCDAVVESAAFSGVDGVLGSWKATVGGVGPVELGTAGEAKALDGCEVLRGGTAAVSLDTTFGSFAAGKMVGKSLGSLTLAFSAKVEAFAVYSADDDSLTFYKRGGKPKAGDVLCGKAVTEMYTGFEEDVYEKSDGADWFGAVDTPWYGKRNDIESVVVSDEGISPASLQYWFQNFSAAKSFDLSKLDTPKSSSLFHLFNGCQSATAVDLGDMSSWSIKSIDGLFLGCSSLESVDISTLDFGHLSIAAYAFYNCTSLREITGIRDLAKAGPWRIDRIFSGCSSLETIDLSNWDTRTAAEHSDSSDDGFGITAAFAGCGKLHTVTVGPLIKWGSKTSGQLPTPSTDYIENADGKWYNSSTGVGYAPADMPAGVAATYVAVDPKTAFAVYSDTDKSLDFYKRMSVPNVGETFNGKAVTAVYTGFETDEYATRADVPWKDHKADIVTVEAVDEIRPKSMRHWFDMGDIKDSSGNGCSPLKTAKLSRVDTSRCTSFFTLFQFDVNLENVEGAGSWDTSKVTDMTGAFDNCPSLASLDVSGWDTAKVTDMSYMFFGCTSLTTLDVSKWDTSSCTTMMAMFYQDSALTSLDVSKWDTGKVTDMGWLFYGCTGLTSLDVSKWETSACARMKSMFNQDSALISLDVSKWDTSKVTDMSYMFFLCTSLTHLDVSGWDTSSCTTMHEMFAGYGDDYMNLATVGDLSGWDTSHVTDMSWMFQDCEYLESIGDISGWDVSNANVEGLFNRCVRLDGVGDLSGWDVSKTTSFDSMFRGQGMTKVGMDMDVSFVKSWNVSNATKFDEMFEDCSKQAELDLSGWDFSKATSANNMFSGATGLKKITLPSSWKWLDGGRLPSPSATYVSGADGKWHTEDGASYAPAQVPDGAGTYYAAALSGSVSVSGDAAVGGTLTASVSGTQSDSEPAYEWVRTKQEETTEHIEFTGETITRTIEVTTAPATLKFENVGPIASTQSDEDEYGVSVQATPSPSYEDVKATVMRGLTHIKPDRTDGSNTLAGTEGEGWYQDISYNLPESGTYKITVGSSSDTDLKIGFDMTITEESSFIASESPVYSPTVDDLGASISCRVRDAGALYYGSLESAAQTVGKGTMALSASVSGERYCGSRLSCDVSGLPSGSALAYQWQYAQAGTANWVDSAQGDAASQTFTPNDTWDGFDCRCKVTATCAGYEDAVGYTDAVRIEAQKVAFAVYDGQSLNFYKRKSTEIPAEGSSWSEGWAEKVYTGIEDMQTSKSFEDVPWCADISTGELSVREFVNVTVVDDGIRPKSTAFWFFDLRYLKNCDVSKLDMSDCKTVIGMFSGCSMLSSLDLSNFECPLATPTSAMFNGNTSLTTIRVSEESSCFLSFIELPIPSADTISGADGNWYALSDGAAYSHGMIPDHKADTYYASKSLRDSAVANLPSTIAGAATWTVHETDDAPDGKAATYLAANAS